VILLRARYKYNHNVLYVKRVFLTVKVRGRYFKKSMIEVADSSFFQAGRWLELDYENSDSSSKVTVVGIMA